MKHQTIYNELQNHYQEMEILKKQLKELLQETTCLSQKKGSLEILLKVSKDRVFCFRKFLFLLVVTMILLPFLYFYPPMNFFFSFLFSFSLIFIDIVEFREYCISKKSFREIYQTYLHLDCKEATLLQLEQQLDALNEQYDSMMIRNNVLNRQLIQMKRQTPKILEREKKRMIEQQKRAYLTLLQNYLKSMHNNQRFYDLKADPSDLLCYSYQGKQRKLEKNN